MIKSNLRQKFNPIDSGIGFLSVILSVFVAAVLLIIILLIYIFSNTNIYNFSPDSIDVLLNKEWVLLFSAALNQFVFLGAYFFICRIRKTNSIRSAGLNVAVKWQFLLIIPILALFLIVADTYLLTALEDFFIRIDYKEPIQNFDTFLSNPGGIIILILAVCVLPAVCEELIFRGLILRGLAARFKPFIAIIFSALIFSLSHMSPSQTIHQFILGIALGYLVLTTGSIWASMLMHFCNNLFAVLSMIFMKEGYEIFYFDNTVVLYISGIIFAVIGIIAFFFLIDLVNKKVKRGIFLTAIKEYGKNKEPQSLWSNYDVTRYMRDDFKNLDINDPIYVEEYNRIINYKERSNKFSFRLLMGVSFGFCILIWLFSLYTGIVS